MYMHAKRSCTHVKDAVAHVRVRWIMEVPKYNFVVPGTLIIIQNALKISAFKVLKLDITWKMKKSKNFSLSLSVSIH